MSGKPIRVLHAFGSLGQGGIETWLTNILRLHPDGLQFDFFLNTLGGAYEAEVRSRGCRIHHAPPIRQLSENLHFLENVLARNHYDVYHVHGEEFMGDAVKVAARVGVPVRIAHCHNTVLARGKQNLEMKFRLLRFNTLDRSRILGYATDIVACSTDAGHFLVGNHWERDARCKPLYCGIPLDDFNKAQTRWTRHEYRAAHGIPPDAIVVGHVGSMGPGYQKNHSFLLKVLRELAQHSDRYYLYMAGDGPLRAALEQEVNHMNLQSRVMMPGVCDDVPSLMVHGFDVHLLPSLQEGLPIVGLEAVASGLHTVCSDTITRDFTEYFSERVTRISLKASPSAWADQVAKGIRKRISTEEGIAIVESSPFSMRASLSNLIRIYRRTLESAVLS